VTDREQAIHSPTDGEAGKNASTGSSRHSVRRGEEFAMRARLNRTAGIVVLATVVAAGIAAAVVAGSSGDRPSGKSSSTAVDGGRGTSGSGPLDSGSGPYAAGGAASVPTTTAPSGANGAGSTVPLSKAVVRTASIDVRVARIGVADQVRAIAEGAGGSVDEDNRNTGGVNATADGSAASGASATLVLAVPPDRLGYVLSRVSALGTELSRGSTSQDVTGQVADVKSRLDSARRSIDRIRVLFSNATRIGDIISLESELATREADLESLQAQQRALDAQTSMAHVTVQLTTTGAVGPGKADRSGFLGGLSSGWDGFRTAGSALLTAVGVVAPFALALLVVGAAVAIPVRRRRRATPPPVPDAM
jgi:hypothetical protein